MADKKKEITSLDLESIVNDELRLEHDAGKWELMRCQVVCGDQQVPTATIALLNKETNQEILMGTLYIRGGLAGVDCAGWRPFELFYDVQTKKSRSIKSN